METIESWEISGTNFEGNVEINIKRLLKVLNAQSERIESLEKRIISLESKVPCTDTSGMSVAYGLPG